MEFNQIPGHKMSFPMQLIDEQDKICLQDVMEVAKDPSIDGVYTVRTRNALYRAQCTASDQAKRMEDEALTGVPYLARIVDTRHKGFFTLAFNLFSGTVEEMSGSRENPAVIDIGVDERVLSQARTKQGMPRDAFGLCDGLTTDFLYERDDGATWFFMITGPAAEAEFRRTEVPVDGDDDVAHPPVSHPTHLTAFQLISAQSSFVASETEVAEGRKIYLMSRYHQRKNRTVIDHSVRLVHGLLKFSNWTETGEISKIVQGQLAKLNSAESTYLKKWDEFGDREGDILLKKARKLGMLHYTSFVAERDGTLRLTLDTKPDEEWTNVSAVEIVDGKPLYLVNDGMTFSDYINHILPPGLDPEEFKKKTGNRVCKVEGVIREAKELILSGEENLPSQQGYLVMSLAGDLAQIKRRVSARRRISEGRSANPSLRLLIEDAGEPLLLRRPRKVNALTPFVKRKIFSKNPPTEKQAEAIRIALNTPDIALIQGPPGTGKTTVITAILERLNEESDKTNVRAGRVLLTGFQHDAVENMISRMSINSLPVPKFGKRSNSDDDDDQYQIQLEQWCHALAEKIREKYPQLKKTEAETRLDNLCAQYQSLASTSLGDQIVQIVASDDSPVPDELRTKALKMLAFVKRRNTEERMRGEVIRCIRNLRVTDIGFADDGPDRALDLKMALDDLGGVQPQWTKALDDVSGMPYGEIPSDDVIVQLRALKSLLMSAYAPRPHFKREKRNQDVERLAHDVRQAIRYHRKQNNGGLYAAMARFLAVLDQKPELVFESLSDYSFAYAATCQQSQGKEMATLKLKNTDADEESTDIEYDYVIVDEAARVSPRDLMIALAQGRRIVLVGDHRQLPHIIDEEVAAQMEKGDASTVDELEWLKKSMFEYLFSERIPVLEKRDNIVRHVTLNVQYRMHPLLGDFISQNFYERFDTLERVQSGLGAELFNHDLPDTDGVPAIWLDVPTTLGAFERLASGSLVRDCEAKAIRKLYSKWFSCEAGRNLSYGIISFYKGQAKRIRREIGGGDNTSELRIGTVDSFQGMEFDVVFLSLVRTHREATVNVDEKQAARMYGFLSLYNRLNVSMSRQKKLLVLVGDAALTTAPFAEKYIPGLVNFRKLCETQGRIIHVS